MFSSLASHAPPEATAARNSGASLAGMPSSLVLSGNADTAFATVDTPDQVRVQRPRLRACTMHLRCMGVGDNTAECNISKKYIIYQYIAVYRTVHSKL